MQKPSSLILRIQFQVPSKKKIYMSLQSPYFCFSAFGVQKDPHLERQRLSWSSLPITLAYNNNGYK